MYFCRESVLIALKRMEGQNLYMYIYKKLSEFESEE